MVPASIRRLECEDPVIARGRRKHPGVEGVLELIQKSLDDDKALELITIPLAGRTPIADFMVIASGGSHRQVGAMADHLVEKLKQAGLDGIAVEGKNHCDWVLVDAGDVVVHLFRPEVREFYRLEKLWSDVPETKEASEPVSAVGG